MPSTRTFSLSLPPFTRAVRFLVIVNAVVFLVLTLLKVAAPGFAGVAIAFTELIPAYVTHGFVWQLVTYSFLHVGIFHILFNMLWLWMFGAQLESDWGFQKFLEFYFFCVIGAALTTVAISYTGIGGVSPNVATQGASGGVMGILMAFGVLYADQEITLFPIPISIRAKYFVAIIAFVELISAISAADPLQRGGSVAYIAHLGGLLFGFLYVKFIPRRGLMFSTSERWFGVQNSFHRWKRRRAARKFEVYMREHGRTVKFDQHGNYVPPDDLDKSNGGSKPSGWVN